MKDEKYMSLALELALKGCGKVNPNPMVGAVIVKNGKVIGQGYHEKYGLLHAERNALASCSESPKGATMYVTLEPCSHYGKTPPCTTAIIESGIKRVVVGSLDPNPLNYGKGIELLINNGIGVNTGVLEKACQEINHVFFHYIKNKTPFVVMKYAMTVDGKIATVKGESRWITGENARENVHLDRNRYSSIMVGIGTIMQDNPMLTCRIAKGNSPIRVIADTKLRTPLNSNVVKTTNVAETIIATSCNDINKHKDYTDRGCQIILVPEMNGHLDLTVLMKELGERKIDSIFLEGGAELNYSALSSGIVNRIQTYIAPKIFGGVNAKTAIGGSGIPNINSCINLKNQKIRCLGEDIFIESEVEYPCLQE